MPISPQAAGLNSFPTNVKATAARTGAPSVASRALTGDRTSSIKRLQAIMAAETHLSLQKGSETLLFLHADPTRPSKGTIIMYHGFTAGSWQFEILAKQASEAGYDVYVPRLPGHGLMDRRSTAGAIIEDPSQLLTAKNWRDYQTFAERTYLDARGLGGPVHVMGLSVGGNIALEVAERHPEISRVVAYAPFLKPPGFAGRIIDVVRMLDKVTFGLAGRALSWVPWGWGKECEAETARGDRPGHSKFNLGCIYAATQLGSKLVKEAPAIKAPVQFFTTAVDDAADEGTIRKLHDRAGGDPRHGWYHYPTAEGVPHPMVHPREDKGHGQTPALYAMTLRFLETGVPLDRGE